MWDAIFKRDRKHFWSGGVWLVFLIFCMNLIGCQRSPAYRRDQDYAQTEIPLSYYNDKKPLSATQKVENIAQPKKKVMVFNFWNDTPLLNNVTEGIGKFSAVELKRGLDISQRVILLSDPKTGFSTENFIQGNQIKVAQLIREGRRLGVAALVIGKISKLVFRQKGGDIGIFKHKQSFAASDIEIKIFDVANGKEVLATSRSADSQSGTLTGYETESLENPLFRTELIKLAVRNTVAQLIPDVLKAIDKLAWEGRVAKVSSGKIYISSGKVSGLVAGDILKVMATGEDIFDPITGAFLGRAPGQLKGTLEVIDFLGMDGAIAQIHTGSNFLPGDIVQLY